MYIGNYQTLLALALLCGLCGIHSFKIAIVPKNIASHVIYFARVGKLLKTHGNDVTLIIGSTTKLPEPVVQAGFKIKTYFMNEEPITQMKGYASSVAQWALKPSLSGAMKLIDETQKSFNYQCEALLSDEAIMKHMTAANYDLLIIDLVSCDSVLPYKLSKPFAILGASGPPWYYRVPDMPSYVPSTLTTFSDKMTFSQRFLNYLTYLMQIPLLKTLDGNSLVKKYVPEKETVFYSDIAGQHALYLQLSDLMTSYPRPVMPTFKSILGIIPTPAIGLTQDLEALMHEAKHGVVIASFGSWLTSIPDEVLVKIFKAFETLDQYLILRYNGDSTVDVPKNVKLLSWLPQNDLLGHPNTKVFITHAGLNSLTEAVYHGVPMIALPLFIDQFHNAATAEAKGYGKWMSFSSFTSEELASNVRRLVTDKNYQKTAKKASCIFKEIHANAENNTVFWIEHVIKHGSSHLHSAAYDLPLYQYLSLDVISVLILITILVIFIFIICARCLCSCFCRLCRHRKEKRE